MEATPEQWTAMSKAVTQFAARPDAEPFRNAVPWKEMGLSDYPVIIKNPMDLGLVKKNISSKKYTSLEDAANDVRLVWKNCMTYNADGSEFYVLAQSLSKRWEEKYAKVLKDLRLTSGGPSTQGSATVVSAEERRAFAKSLHKISKEELGKVLVELDLKCPSALTKNSSEDEMEVNIDAIQNPLFSELVDYVDSCVKKKKKAKR